MYLLDLKINYLTYILWRNILLKTINSMLSATTIETPSFESFIIKTYFYPEFMQFISINFSDIRKHSDTSLWQQ